MDLKEISASFPALNRLVNGKPIIYFDNACMSMVPQAVIDSIVSYYRDYPACAGRSVHRLSLEVSTKYEEARDRTSEFFNGDRNSFIFLRNTTEGINLVARAMEFKRGDMVVTTDREHNSNLSVWHFLSREKGVVHRVVLSNKDNSFNIENFKNIINKKVKLVSMAHVSNLDGVSIPVKEIIDIAHQYNIPVMLDGAQAAPHMKLDLKKMDVDFYALSMHKMCGPNATGVLYGKYELLRKMKPFIVGGGTVQSTSYGDTVYLDPPERYEAGLQNYASVIAVKAALDFLSSIGMDWIEEHVHALNKRVTEGLKDLEGLHVIGPRDSSLRGSIFAFILDHFSAHDIAMILDESENIFIRSGLHCDHSWFNDKKISGSARASFYLYNTMEEADIFVYALKKLYNEFKGIVTSSSS